MLYLPKTFLQFEQYTSLNSMISLDYSDMVVLQYNKETYARFQIFSMRESPSLVNGVRFRSLSFRSSWVQIPSPALQLVIF